MTLCQQIALAELEDKKLNAVFWRHSEYQITYKFGDILSAPNNKISDICTELHTLKKKMEERKEPIFTEYLLYKKHYTYSTRISLILEKAMASHSSTLAGKSHGWRSLVGCLYGVTELATTEAT